jgi:hypothetical protein
MSDGVKKYPIHQMLNVSQVTGKKEYLNMLIGEQYLIPEQNGKH